MWMRHPCSCTARWCGRHSETRLSSSVGPPSAQWMMWWPSVHAGGRSHPGKRQPWSRRQSAVRMCGRDRARGPSDRERHHRRGHRRAEPGIVAIGRRHRHHGPHRVAGDATRGLRVDRPHALELGGAPAPAPVRSVSALTVTVRWGRCPCTSRWSPQRSCRAARSTSASARRCDADRVSPDAAPR